MEEVNTKKSTGGKALKVWNWLLILAFIFFAVCFVWEFASCGSYTVTMDDNLSNTCSATCRANSYFPSITDLDNSNYDATGVSSGPYASIAEACFAAEHAYREHIKVDFIVNIVALAVIAVLLVITAIIRRKKK